MRAVDERRFTELVRDASIAHVGCKYLDQIKIGLSVQPTARSLPPIVDVAKGVADSPVVDLRVDPLLPGTLYLLESAEAISLPSFIFGFMHTRSRFARLGIDFLRSSTYVAPSFGGGIPSKIVFEVTCSAVTHNLPLDTPIVGLVLFELSKSAPRPAGVAAVQGSKEEG